jgi:hypothetical protein
MFVSAIKKAHDAVEGLAYEASLGLTAVLLACGAILLAAVGFAMWLSTIIPAHFAILLSAFIVALLAIFVFILSRQEPPASHDDNEEQKSDKSPLVNLTKSISSMAGPMDVVASGLFARQFKKSPVATLAATAAVGALLGMMADAADDD